MTRSTDILSLMRTNLLEETFIDEMNKVFDRGYRVITSYRNSKNYGTTGFLPDMRSGSSGTVSSQQCQNAAAHQQLRGGTGLMHRDIVKKEQRLEAFTLTEDTEFTIDCITHGEEIALPQFRLFLYDEQPAPSASPGTSVCAGQKAMCRFSNTEAAPQRRMSRKFCLSRHDSHLCSGDCPDLS